MDCSKDFTPQWEKRPWKNDADSFRISSAQREELFRLTQTRGNRLSPEARDELAGDLEEYVQFARWKASYWGNRLTPSASLKKLKAKAITVRRYADEIGKL